MCAIDFPQMKMQLIFIYLLPGYTERFKYFRVKSICNPIINSLRVTG